MTDGVAVAPKRAELRQLTGVRFIAAVWVVLYHFRFMILGIVPELKPVGFLFEGGYLAVDVFFVLSGYIIAYQYLRAFPRGRGDFGAFLVKRLARIYRLQVVTLAFTVVTILVGIGIGVPITPASNFTVWGAVQDVLLIRGWVFPSQGWNFPAWSLSAEWFAYLLFPVVAIVVVWAVRRRGRVLALAAVCVLVEGVAAFLLPSFDGMPHPLLRVMTAFLLGALIQAATPGTGRPALAIAGIVVLVALMIGGSLIPFDGLRAAVSLAAAAAALAGLANGSGAVVRVLGSRLLEYGGRISYGMYMAHGILLMILSVLLGGLSLLVPLPELLTWPVIARIGIVIVPLLVVVLAGAGLYHGVERPAQRLLTARLRHRPVPAAVVDD